MKAANKIFKIAIFLSLQLCASFSVAQWVEKNNGLNGGEIRAFAVQGSNIFACTVYGGVYRSSNNGSTWTAVNTGLTILDPRGLNVRCIAVSGSNIFVGSEAGVYLSNNSGDSWTEMNSGLSTTWVESLVFSGSNLFAGTAGGGMFLSTNNGSSWTAINNGLLSTDIYGLTAIGTNIFAGTPDSGVYLTSNNGTLWTQANTGLTSTYVGELASSGSNIFAGTGTGVFLSTNNGASWTAVNSGLTSLNIKSLSIAGGSTLFAGTPDGVFKSVNNGTLWSAFNSGLTNLNVAEVFANGSGLFAGTLYDGVYFSPNTAASWTLSNSGMTNVQINSIGTDGTNIFAGSATGEMWLSTTDASSWGIAGSGLPGSTSIKSIIFKGGNVFSGTDVGVYVSSNNGSSWHPVISGLTNTSVNSLAVSGSNIFAGTYGGVFISANDGTSWSPVNNGLTGGLIVNTLTVKGTALFAGTNDAGVFISTNNGSSWSPINNGIPAGYISKLFTCNSDIFAFTSNTLYRTSNDGVSWTSVSLSTGWPISSVVSVPGLLFAGFYGAGIYFSKDNGNSWSEFDIGLPSKLINSLGVQGDLLIAGTSGSGTWGMLANAVILPTISSFFPTSGPIGTSVTITGTNFSTTLTNNTVYFGATKATVTAATATQLTVTVPPGATYQPISVLVNGLLAYSDNPFVVTFPSASGLSGNSFAAKTDFTVGSSPNFLGTGDLDLDGKIDVVVTNGQSNTVSVLRNSSSAQGTINFDTKIDLTTGVGPLGTGIGDFDGDGKLDVVVCNSGESTISVFRNTTASSGSITFGSKTNFTLTSGNATRVATGDLDGDGRTDLAVTNSSNNVSVFRNTSVGAGSLSFASPIDFVTGTTPGAVAFSDFDNDGKVDMAVANESGNTVSIFQNAGSGAGSISFNNVGSLSTVAVPKDIAIGDLDGDGKTDLVIPGLLGGVSLIRNTSTGAGVFSFSSKQDLTMPGDPYNVAITDMDSDGKLDLAVTNSNNIAIWVFKNESSVGALAFDPGSPASTGTGPEGIIIADLDNDGKPDVAVVNNVNNSISVLRNIIPSPPTITSFNPASGPIGTSVTITGTNFDGATAVSFGGTAASSFNVDSPTSITAVVGSGSSGNVSVTTPGGTAPSVTEVASNLVANTTTGWTGAWQKITTTNQGTISSVVLKLSNTNSTNDYNLYLELHATDNNPSSADPTVKFNSLIETSNTVKVAHNTSFTEITFSFPGINILTASTPYYVVIKEVQGDPAITGEQNIYLNPPATDGGAGNNFGTLYYKFYMGNTTLPGFAFVQAAPTITSFTPASGGVGSSVIITGTNFDSAPSNNIVYFGATKATVTAASATQLTVTVPVGATYQPITVTVNGLTANSNAPFIVTFSSGATINANSFVPNVDFGSGGTHPKNVSIGDVDGDGVPDLVVTNGGSNTVSIHRNVSGSGNITSSSFAPKVDFTTGVNPYGVALGDIDGDGKLDLAVANSLGSTVSVFLNTSVSGALTTSSFASKVDFTTGAGPYGVAIGDVDGDGKPDIVVANNNGSSVSVLRNTSVTGSISSSSFSAKVDFTAGTWPWQSVVGDLDGDGKLDLVVSNNGSNTLSVFRNTSVSGTISPSSFAAKVDLTTAGGTPFGVVIGDVDMDGKPDLITTSYTSGVGGNVSVFRNTSTPGSITTSSFSSKVDFATGTDPYGIAIGDVNGDSKPDLVGTNYNGGGGQSISVFRNTSTSGSITASSFATALTLITGTGPFNLAIGDLNGDGRPDLAVANYTDNTISLLGNLIGTPPTITSFNPGSGPVGTSVAITGTNFDPTPSNNTVKFNGIAAVVTASTITSITTSVPAGATTGVITVTVAGIIGTSSTNFIVTPGTPTITNFNPASGPVGTSVTITGTNFDGTPANNTVKFNGTAATVTASTSTSITTSVPAGATNGVITVTVAGNTGTSATNFSVTAPGSPIITNFNPAFGIVGTAVTITGTNFDTTPANNTVKFNGTAATVTASTAISISTSVPTGATTGPITVTVNGLTGTSANFIIDNTPPIATLNTVPSPSPLNAPINLSVNCADPQSGITAAYIKYRPINGAAPNNFVSVIMSNSSGNIYQGAIPASAVTELGVEYKIQTQNGVNLWNTDSLTLYTSRVNFASGLDISSYPSTAAGTGKTNYRIISIPLVLTNSTANGIFSGSLGSQDNTKWRMFKYNGTGFDPLPGTSSLIPGQGYWFIAKSFSGSLNTGAGTTVDVSTASPFPISLAPGWNQIGNPYDFNISWADILAANSSNAASLNNNRNIVTYNGSVVNGSPILHKFEGGFIKNTGTSTFDLTIPVAKNASAQSGRIAGAMELRNSLDQPDWEIPLSLQIGNETNNLGGIGMHPDASVDFDHYDDFALPRFINYLEVKFPKSYLKMTYTKSVVPTSNNFVWDFSIESDIDEELGVLTWDNSYFGTEKEIYLLDVRSYQVTDMRSINSYQFNKSKSSEFKIIFGNGDFVKGELIPSAPILFDPYPNPANGVVMLQFSLPEMATVQQGIVKIYNSLGQEVSSANTPLQSGQGQMQWDSGSQSPGLYFVNLKIGDHTVTKKIIKL